MIIFAILTLTALANGLYLETQPASLRGNYGNPLQQMCEAIGASYDAVEMAATNFVYCMENDFEVKMFEREFKEAQYNGSYDKVFKKYCAKTPQLKYCYHTLMDAVAPCVGNKNPDMITTMKQKSDQIVDYLCIDDGYLLTAFIREGGPECFQSKSYDIMMCAESTKSALMYSLGQNKHLSLDSSLYKTLLQCVGHELEKCHNPIPSQIFWRVARTLRGGFLQETKPSVTVVHPGVGHETNYTWSEQVTPRTITTQSKRLAAFNKFRKACEQNNVDYNKIELATNDFVKCVEYNLKPETFLREFIEAQSNTSYSKLFRKYCAKIPQLKTCYYNLTNVMSTCLGVQGKKIMKISESINDQILDHVCYNDGYRITRFITEGGMECYQSKIYEIKQCNEDFENFFFFIFQNETAVADIIVTYEKLLNCMVQKLETCDKPIASETFKSLAEVVHKAILKEIVVNKENSTRVIIESSTDVNTEISTLAQKRRLFKTFGTVVLSFNASIYV